MVTDKKPARNSIGLSSSASFGDGQLTIRTSPTDAFTVVTAPGLCRTPSARVMHSPYEKTLANSGLDPDTSDSECPPITGSELWPCTGLAVYVWSCPMRVMITPAATALPWNTNRCAKRSSALAGLKALRDFVTFTL